MYQRCLIAVLLVIILDGCMTPTPEETAQDPFIGTWELNVSKSNFTPALLEAFGISKPQQETIVVRDLNRDEIEAAVTGSYIDGALNSQIQRVHKQGGIVKFQQGGPPEGSYYVETKISEKEKYRTRLQNGNQVQVSHFVISKDGKILNIAITGVDDQGNPFNGLYLFEKQ